MQHYQKIGPEFIELLLSDPFNIPVWWMLQIKFMLPAIMIAHNDEMEKYISAVSLNGIKNFSICR